jgi:hypothetical protein
MANPLTQSLFADTYKDDYRDSDNYHRILFNSGRALQARELTQMQTIIQGEIARFGRNIFKEGASVNPGGFTINPTYEFVKLNTAVYTLPGTSLVGSIFTGASSGLRAEVIETVAAVGADPATLYVKYIGGISASISTSLRFTPGEQITDGTNTLVVQTTNTGINPAIGAGVRFSASAGDFFTQGHFVFAESQSLILSKYSNSYTGTVGFVVTQDIVTVADTTALYDNQGATPNTTAPGADRYRIRLTLIDQDNILATDTFVYVAKIVNSVIVNNVTGTDEYNKINTLLAKRTKEESGDYIVRPFFLKFDEDSDDNVLQADISPGTAYINGYRVELSSPKRIRFSKPTTTTTFNNQAIAASYGNYVLASTIKGTPLINTHELWLLKSAVTFGGTNLGTARVRAVEEDGANYRYYITDVKMYGTNKFSAVRSIGSSIYNYADLILENSLAVIKDAANNDLLFPLPLNRPKNLTDYSLQIQKRFTTTAAAGTATLGPGLLGTGETWTDTNAWIIAVDSNGQNVSSTATVTGTGTTTATISGLSPYGGTIEVLAYVDKSSAAARAKTITETTVTASVVTDSSGNKILNLGKADVYDILRLRKTDSNGIDLTNYFRFDNGQRDNFYDTGKLVLKSTFSDPGSTFVRFRYFTHGAGDFFDVTSYDSVNTGLSYGEIPSHTFTNGATVHLANYLDFRPRIGDKGTTFDSSTAKVNFLPKNGDVVRSDVDYYLPRYDKMIADEAGSITIISGEPSLNPTYPTTPSNTLELYKIRLNANTFNDSDLGITAIDHKRYTMADIGKLEKRIDRLEEYTTLSLLEMNTNNYAVVDSTGINRTKAGFLADGFNDHFFSDTTSQEYRASIDPTSGVVQPSVVSRNVRLKYDSSLSSNVILKGDNVYLSYVDSAYIEQTSVSGTENINPFAVVFNQGVLELSPASDEWLETQYVPARTIDGGTRLNTDQTTNFNAHQWNWQGLSGDLTGTVADQSSVSTRRKVGRRRFFFVGPRRTEETTTTTTTRVVSDETIRNVIGDRVVDVAFILTMRSRKVSFKASGLKPFQRYYPFFDNTDVSAWCREEAFTRFSTTTEDYGTRYNQAVAHPQTSSILTSDSNGTISGSFFIPSTPAIKFRTGSYEFKLNNVSSANEAAGTSVAKANFVSSGMLETRQRDVISTRVITLRTDTTTTVREVDPLAQTFVVDTDDGVFLTKVAIYFKSKPTGAETPAPVMLEIRPVVNGYPSSGVAVPGSLVVLTPSQVSVAATQTQAGVLAAPTYFTFSEPVYLNGQTEYCIVLLTDSTAYNVYVAQIDQPMLGSTSLRIGKQPSLGSLFKSQNSRTWEPDQTKDLMFQLYKAKFTTSAAYATLENVDVPLVLLEPNPIQMDSASRWATIYHPNHGFDSGDIVKIYGLDSATTYNGIRATSILGSNAISFPDATGYQIYMDSSTAAGAKAFVGGSNVSASQNIIYDVINPHLEILTPPNTSTVLESKITSGRSLAGIETRFVKETTFNVTSVKEDNYSSNPNMIANSYVEAAAPLSGARSATFKVSMETTSVNVSPVIDLQRASLILITNIIDKQSSDRSLGSLPGRTAGSGVNTPLAYKAETDPTDGSHIAKHITVPVTLADQAVGLQIVLGANRPADADFEVYYRTATSGNNIRLLPYTLVTAEGTVPSDDNPNVFREYKYLVGGKNGTLTPFSQYQLKIVFRSSNSSKVPAITDLRVIALAD